jgi:hypothetical protein
LEQEVDKNLELVKHQVKAMEAIPKTKVNFSLKRFSARLDDQGQGVEFCSTGFNVDLSIFDSTNKYCRHSLEVGLALKEYGVDVVTLNDRTPFV